LKQYLALATAALLSASALAQEPGQAARTPFDMLDADRSGSINVQEARAHPTVSENFTEADRDADGALTRNEFNAAFTSTQPQRQPEPQQPESLPPER
jgi:Ca2+-binding EF-hand superfamily protein